MPMVWLTRVSTFHELNFSASLWLQGLYHRLERRLRFSSAVKQQRVVHPPPRKAIQPALAVVKVPEGDARDEIGVLAFADAGADWKQTGRGFAQRPGRGRLSGEP